MLVNCLTSGRICLSNFNLYMHLREGEQIMRVFHHHPTPFVLEILKTIGAVLPFFFLLFFLQDSVSVRFSVIGHLVVLVIFSMVVIYQSLVYWLDRFVVTNIRIYQVDWKYLTSRTEAEALLEDIQDVTTAERGIWAYFKAFDYGTIKIETASSHVTLFFENAPNPEEMRQFIYHVRQQ